MEDKDIEISRLKKYINELEAELKASKKYGLVWDKENTVEDVALMCSKFIPILKNVESKNIINGELNNLLIEGDKEYSKK